jgi:release factor family 10
MLTHTELLSLSHLLRDEHVLSVYVDGTIHDPAQQRAWRVQLDHSVDAARRALDGASHAERAAFERCVTLLDERLAQFGGAIGALGWVAFITPTRVHLDETVPAPMPTLAVWGTGICLTPYMRGLKQTRPVVVVVADARRARIYRYAAGTLADAETIHAHAVTEPPSHMGNPPRAGFHGGTRGATGESAAQRALTEGTNRMIAEVARTAATLAGADGWIVAGGIRRVASQLTHALEDVAAKRVCQVQSLDVHATNAEIAAVAEQSASTLRDAAARRDVEAIISLSERTGAAAVGIEATRYALEQGCVRELYLTEQYIHDHGATAEEAVRAALAQGAGVEEVSRGVGSLLDERGGIGARLRYALTKTGASMSIVGAPET